MLDSSRQIIRWAIPGWLFFTFMFLFYAIEWAVRGQSGFKDHLLSSLSGLTSINPTVVILTIAGIGIPLGYLFYQLYYWGYWRGFEWDRDNPKDKGLAVLRGVNIDTHKWFWEGLELIDPQDQKREYDPYNFYERMTAFKKVRSNNWGRTIFNFFHFWLELTPLIRTRESADRYKHNWFLAESVFYKTVIELQSPMGKYWEDRAVFMADVYHSLGAVRVTLVSAFTLYTVITIWAFMIGIDRGAGHTVLIQFVIWLINLISSVLIYVVLRANRRTVRDNLITLKRHVIVLYNQPK